MLYDVTGEIVSLGRRSCAMIPSRENCLFDAHRLTHERWGGEPRPQRRYDGFFLCGERRFFVRFFQKGVRKCVYTGCCSLLFCLSCAQAAEEWRQRSPAIR